MYVCGSAKTLFIANLLYNEFRSGHLGVRYNQVLLYIIQS